VAGAPGAPAAGGSAPAGTGAKAGANQIEAKATARYVRTSAQKAGLVLALIRGKDVIARSPP